MGNAELDEVAPTFRELLVGSGVSFVQARVSDVDLGSKEVSLEGALSDDLDGFMISDNADDRKSLDKSTNCCDGLVCTLFGRTLATDVCVSYRVEGQCLRVSRCCWHRQLVHSWQTAPTRLKYTNMLFVSPRLQFYFVLPSSKCWLATVLLVFIALTVVVYHVLGLPLLARVDKA